MPTLLLLAALGLQISTRISGSVTDATSLPLPGATVELDGRVLAASDERGAFEIVVLSGTQPRLRVSLDGFEPQESAGFAGASASIAAPVRDDALKGQLRPHFLLNSLNSILTLIDEDPAEARRMIASLSSLLHAVFDGLDEPFVPLDRELRMVRDYLEVERIRFGDRLRFTVDADPSATGVLVPPLLLQPLVENAVRHGIEPSSAPGMLRVHAQAEHGRLQIRIANTVNGSNGRGGTGRGLELTRLRLRTIYGEQGARFSAGVEAGGFEANVDLPMVPHRD
jgi:two-component system sensor histidine kinase AlgZ